MESATLHWVSALNSSIYEDRLMHCFKAIALHLSQVYLAGIAFFAWTEGTICVKKSPLLESIHLLVLYSDSRSILPNGYTKSLTTFHSPKELF